jgi:hypothetical protein
MARREGWVVGLCGLGLLIGLYVAVSWNRAPAPAWAGEYQGGWRCGRITVALARDGAVRARQQGCARALFERPSVRKGRVVELADGRLEIHMAGGPSDAKPRIAPAYRFVRWGDRRYLVAADDLIGFTSVINVGDEPRIDAFGPHLLRKGDETRPVVGLPGLPAASGAVVRSRPLEVRIVEAEALTHFPDDGGLRNCNDRFRITVEKGADDGLSVGEYLRVDASTPTPDTSSRYLSAVVRSVEAHRATAEAFSVDCHPKHPPGVGWVLTTGAYDSLEAARRIAAAAGKAD